MTKKYKYFTKVRNVRLFPSRLLKFKRSKWNILKSLLVKRVNKDYSTQQHISKWSHTKSYINKKYVVNKITKKQNYKKYIKKNILIKKFGKKFFLKRFRLGLRKKLLSRLVSKRFRRFRFIKKKNNYQRFKVKDKFKISGKRGRLYYMSRLSKDKIRLRIKLKNVLNQFVIPTRKNFKEKETFVKHVYSSGFQLKGVFSSYYFFSNGREVSDKIKQGILYLNNKKLNKLELLKLGDLISIKSNAVDLKKNKQKFISNFCHPSHLECDIYSQTILLIKDINLVSKSDYHLMSLEYVNVRKL